MMIKKFIVATASLFCVCNTVFAWSREGHQMVVEVVSRLLSNNTKEKNLSTAATSLPVQQTTQQKTEQTFTAFEAKDHTGEKITVCDKVFGTRFLENSNGQLTFLNLGAAYPNSPFTIVIFGNERANFKEKPELYYNNKKVCATGLIKEYNGKPEMIITKEDEIKIAN